MPRFTLKNRKSDWRKGEAARKQTFAILKEVALFLKSLVVVCGTELYRLVCTRRKRLYKSLRDLDDEEATTLASDAVTGTGRDADLEFEARERERAERGGGGASSFESFWNNSWGALSSGSPSGAGSVGKLGGSSSGKTRADVIGRAEYDGRPGRSGSYGQDEGPYEDDGADGGQYPFNWWRHDAEQVDAAEEEIRQRQRRLRGEGLSIDTAGEGYSNSAGGLDANAAADNRHMRFGG